MNEDVLKVINSLSTDFEAMLDEELDYYISAYMGADTPDEGDRIVKDLKASLLAAHKAEMEKVMTDDPYASLIEDINLRAPTVDALKRMLLDIDRIKASNGKEQ